MQYFYKTTSYFAHSTLRPLCFATTPLCDHSAMQPISDDDEEEEDDDENKKKRFRLNGRWIIQQVKG